MHPAPGHTLYYEANGFLRYVDDYIQATVETKEGMMQYKNVPAVHIKGIEGEVRYELAKQVTACHQCQFSRGTRPEQIQD